MEFDIALIGYEEGENLGLRYISSYLQSKSVKTIILPYSPLTKENILSSLLKYNPKIVGFSLIFQRMLNDFNELLVFLRDNNVSSHFTMGGHFPSIEPEKVINFLKPLDSIIRCEGEHTIYELYQNIDNHNNWKEIKGLVYRNGDEIIINKYRKLIENLNELPFPIRNPKPYTHRNIGLSTILTGRGCYYNCCFCSIHEFYRDSEGKRRRRRSPSNVVEEIQILYEKQNVRIIVFEDDDFPLKGKINVEWIKIFLSELKKKQILKDLFFFQFRKENFYPFNIYFSF